MKSIKFLLDQIRPITLLILIGAAGNALAESAPPTSSKSDNTSSEPAARTRLGAKQSPFQSLVVNNKLTLREFMTALASPSHTERHYAEMYLVGVLDATEGRDWCGYDTILPGSAASVMATYAEQQLATRGNERASTVIRDILKDKASCRRRQ